MTRKLVLPDPATLPTEDPEEAGEFWLNVGVLMVSQPSTLATTEPTDANVFWDNGGVVCVS